MTHDIAASRKRSARSAPIRSRLVRFLPNSRLCKSPLVPFANSVSKFAAILMQQHVAPRRQEEGHPRRGQRRAAVRAARHVVTRAPSAIPRVRIQARAQLPGVTELALPLTSKPIHPHPPTRQPHRTPGCDPAGGAVQHQQLAGWYTLVRGFAYWSVLGTAYFR